jgi:chloramphenicol O-acetyltransferase
MFDTMNNDPNCIPDVNCGSKLNFIFFIVYVVIQQYIMINLFILIILQQFDLYYLPDDNVLDRFKADVTNFKFVWRRMSADFEGFKIRGNDVQKFFMELKGDLGMQKLKNDRRSIERELVIMNIQA